MREIFKDIPGYEGKYQVSNLGRVKSLARSRSRASRWGTTSPYTTKEYLMKPRACGDGYVCVALDDRKNRYIHELVVSIFIGPRPENHDILHGDGNRKNNALDNLRYGTKSENNYDQAKHDNLRLSRAVVAEIRSAVGSVSSIAEAHGVSVSHVRRIKSGERRKHG